MVWQKRTQQGGGGPGGVFFFGPNFSRLSFFNISLSVPTTLITNDEYNRPSNMKNPIKPNTINKQIHSFGFRDFLTPGSRRGSIQVRGCKKKHRGEKFPPAWAAPYAPWSWWGERGDPGGAASTKAERHGGLLAFCSYFSAHNFQDDSR